MRPAIAVMLLAGCTGAGCPTDAGQDSTQDDSAGCGTACDDTSGDSDTATIPFDVCGDGLDNNGNGETDEAGCVTAWLEGGYATQGLPDYLTVAPNDSAVWAYSATAADYWSTVGGMALTAESGSLLPLWSTPGGGRPLVAALRLDVGATVVYSTADANSSDHLTVANVPGAGEPASDPQAIDSFDVGVDGVIEDLFSLDAWPDGDAVRLAVGTWLGHAYVATDALSSTGSMAERADLTVSYPDDPDNLQEFGRAVAFLPDSGGDGVPELVVGAPGAVETTGGSAVFIFDGALQGMVSTEDADAVIAPTHGAGYGWSITRLGDIDGDGYDDLAVGDPSLATEIWFGPFTGSTTPDDVQVFGGWAVAGEFSVNGDDAPDLAVAGLDDAIHLFAGPIQRASYSYDDADYVIETPGLDFDSSSQLIFADADGNGTNELVVGDSKFGTDGVTGGPGLIAVYDLSAL